MYNYNLPYIHVKRLFHKLHIIHTFPISCQPRLNKPLGCLIGRVPMKYQSMTVGEVLRILPAQYVSIQVAL